MLRELGISDPKDIDLEVIAWHRKAVVKYRPLESCEARIVGYGDRAVITVDDRKARTKTRARFSLAHELGHWHHHRGRAFVCRPDDIGNRTRNPLDPERVADGYAADLLLPLYLFRPMAEGLKRVSLDGAEQIAEIFGTSLTATAIRLVEHGPEAAMLVCHGRQGRRWFIRGPGVSAHWFPQPELDPNSFAFDAVFGDKPKSRLGRMGAEAWFDRRGADRFEVLEQSCRVGDGEALSLLIFSDDEMLSEDGGHSGRR
ncbi:ImmA/IrrE family metallo-endopeptidase [Skermanella mucosa]|uniref:ImmA/IrrE family metallo-endopeptidase n=1 Tax=Skermanella TaxID=204447 RepID=UPI00192CC5A1|nr:ImmA/IrrE family metallo-endopeptidase [Skermanella mucosa]UEM21278.1 ImmA/IrrE family metallo-endopeptidase [Skermanella mucosa]